MAWIRTVTGYRRLTGSAETDSDRGKLILESTSLIRNNGAVVVEDVIEDLLRSGAWRAYTFPDGSHHEWREREFDYFLSAQQFDWEKIKRNITKPDVLCLVADHFGGPTGSENRRTLDEVREQFPHVRAIKLVSDHVRTAAADTVRRTHFEREGHIGKVIEGSPWVFRVKRKSGASIEEQADAIVARLLDEPALAKRVWQKLHAVGESDRYHRANGLNKPKSTSARARAK